MSFGTVIDEGCFQTGFNTGDFTFVNVCFLLLVTGAFDIQVIQSLAIHKGDTQLLLLSCVD